MYVGNSRINWKCTYVHRIDARPTLHTRTIMQALLNQRLALPRRAQSSASSGAFQDARYDALAFMVVL